MSVIVINTTQILYMYHKVSYTFHCVQLSQLVMEKYGKDRNFCVTSPNSGVWRTMLKITNFSNFRPKILFCFHCNSIFYSCSLWYRWWKNIICMDKLYCIFFYIFNCSWFHNGLRKKTLFPIYFHVKNMWKNEKKYVENTIFCVNWYQNFDSHMILCVQMMNILYGQILYSFSFFL